MAIHHGHAKIHAETAEYSDIIVYRLDSEGRSVSGTRRVYIRFSQEYFAYFTHPKNAWRKRSAGNKIITFFHKWVRRCDVGYTRKRYVWLSMGESWISKHLGIRRFPSTFVIDGPISSTNVLNDPQPRCRCRASRRPSR